MRYCFACGHENPDDIDICLSCAASLGQNCQACGQTVPAGNRFCGQCGTRVPLNGHEPSENGARQLETLQSLRSTMPTSLARKIDTTWADILGERREVTVVFVDVNNFTAAAHDLDSEDTFLLIDEAMRLLVDVVYKYEGTVDKFTGDGLMALFGAPVAHENDPERAVRAALEMQAALRPLQDRIKREFGIDFQVRIGINTGLVVAGKVGSDLHMEYTVIGDTVNLASRLQTAAEPGTILVSFSTYQRTRPLFQFKTLPSLVIKGLPEPIQAFQPLGLRETPGRIRGLPGLQVPMIGRSDALASLKETLERVRAEHCSQIVVLTGEAGLGKSRLVAEFRRSLTPGEVNVYEGSCLSYARSRPLWLVAEILRDILHISEIDPIEIQREALHNYLTPIGLANDEVLPYLTNLLSLPQTDPQTEARLQLLDASMLREQIHAALRQVLLAETRLAPTVLIFEDLHWIDPTSREFLEYLIRTTGDMPLMLILVSRDAECDTVLQPLIAVAANSPDHVIDIQLHALSEAETQLLVDQLIPDTTDEARALKKRIAQRAEGIPFYTEEIVRMLIDQGGLKGEDRVLEVTPQADELLNKVPGTLKGLILARFDRLPDDLRRTLQKAAVLGRSFPVGLLQALNLNGASPETVTMQLKELAERRFLLAERFGAEEGYTFQHTLVQEAVYSTLLKRDRRRLHELAGHAIEQSTYWSPEEQVELLAYHYSESSNPFKAIPFLLSAAQHADRRCANETTIYHCRRAIRLIQDEPAEHVQEYFQARILLARALKFVGKFSEASDILLEVINQLSRQESVIEPELVLLFRINSLREFADIRQREGAYEEAVTHLEDALSVLGPDGARRHPGMWRELMDRIAWVRFRQGKLDEASALATSATSGVDPNHTDDPTTLASLYNTLGGVLWQQGSLSQASDYVERSLQLYSDLGYLWGMAIAYTNLGVLYYARGLWREAAEAFERAYIIRCKNGYIPEQALNLNNLGTLRMAMGDHAQARHDLETSLAISRRLGDDYGAVLAHIGLGQLAVIQARFRDAAAHLDAAQALLNAAGEDQVIQAHWLQALVQAETDLRTAIDTATQALGIAQNAGLAEAEADCRRVLGVLRARAGQYEEAEALLLASIELCRSRHDPYREGLALSELGRLYQRLAQLNNPMRELWKTRAISACNQAAELFERLGARYDLQVVESALAELNAVSGTAIPEGERHTAAVVWLNLSPAIAADDEVVFESISLTLPALISIAEECAGHVTRHQNGLTAVFGAPVAHEDDTARAVQTAWRMLNALRETSRSTEIPLTIRLAVTRGPVVTSQLGHEAETEFVIRGEPLLEAQHLADTCPPGKILVSPAVRAETDHLFIYAPVSDHEVAQLPRPDISEVVGMREPPTHVRRRSGIKTRLIGRDRPLKIMTNLAQNLACGSGGLIWIEGEAGIGKSRLMEEFAASMAKTGAFVATGRCIPQRSRHAFSLFSDLLIQAFNLHPMYTPDQIRTKMDSIMAAWPAEARASRPHLEMLVGVQPGGTAGQQLASLEPDQLRQQLFVALRNLLRSLASKNPVVLLLDDLQWIDPVSAELLLFISNMVAFIPVLFVCAHRSQELDTQDHRLVKAQSLHPAHTVRLTLNRLSRRQSEALLSELLLGAELPTTLRTAILEKSAGNPYYIEEFVRMLIEQGHLRRDDGRWHVAADTGLGDLPVPSSLEALIRSRVDALPANLKRLLQCAAVIGRPCESELLEAVSGLRNTRAALVQLESRGMLYRPASESDQWQISHSLTEAVVYNTLLKARRKALHRKVAETLESRWAGTEKEHAAELAYHFVQAEHSEKALVYAVFAGEQAAARYANEEALIYFQQAAGLLATQPEATDTLRWRITAGLGDVYRFIGRYAESTKVLQAGLSLAKSPNLDADRRAGLYRRLGEVAQKQGEVESAHKHFETSLAILGEPTDVYAQREAARILSSMAWTYFLRGQFDLAQEACEASLAHAQLADSLSELATAENMLGGIFYRQGEWEQAFKHTTKAMVLREQMGYTWGVAATLSNLGVLAVSAGDWPKARSYFEQSLALRQELGDVEGVVIMHNNIGSLLRDQGDLDRAEFHFRESLAVAIPLKMAYHIANSSLGLAQVHLAQGRLADAQEAVDTSRSHAETIGAQELLAETYRIQAEIHLAHARWDEALRAARESATLAAETGARSLEAAAWRVASESELQQSDLDAARYSLLKARRALLSVTDELEAARVAAQAGRLYLRIGDSSEAGKHLRRAKETFTSLGAKPDLQRVNKALNGCSVRQRGSSHTLVYGVRAPCSQRTFRKP